MSTITLLHPTRPTHGHAVMSSPYTDPDCKCTPVRLCSKHAVLARTGHRQAQATPASSGAHQDYDHLVKRSPGFPTIPLSRLPQTEPLDTQQSPWNMTYGGGPTRDQVVDTSFIPGAANWNAHMHPASLPFSQPVDGDIQRHEAASLDQRSMIQEVAGGPTQDDSLQSSHYYEMFGSTETVPYSWMPTQPWLTHTAMPQPGFWDDSGIPSEALRGYGSGSLPGTPSGPEVSVHNTPIETAGEQPMWASTQMSSANTRYQMPQMQTSGMATAQMQSVVTPPRYWMVRTDSAVIEEGGALYIELDGAVGNRERVPAARFESAFQDALQDNRTSPVSMREAWQIRKEGGKSTITYVGPCPAGVIKTRKSSVFAPFIGLYQGRHCVMVVDDTDGSGSPRLRALRSSPYLPDTMSTREAGWLMEAILRRDWTITIEDVMDRMLSRIRLDISTYNRWRRHDKAVYEFEDDPRSRY